MSRLKKLRNFLRNVWLLRRELATRFGLLKRKPVKVAELRCLHCGRLLTKPCRPRHRAHAVQIPEGFPRAGEIVYIAKTKPGKQATDVRSEPF